MGTTWGQLSKIIDTNSTEKKIPSLGQFELTSRCNLKCKMCYVCRRANDNDIIAAEKTAKEWIKLAEEAMDAGMLYLLLTGGEVFLRKDFKTIYEELSKMGLIKSIYSNGTLITRQTAKWLGSMPPSQIDISLYGASADTYARVCGNASGFQQAIHAIDLLLAEGINVQIRTTVINGNKEDFKRLSELAEERGIKLGIVNYISPRREGDLTSPEFERLNPKESAEFELDIEKYYNNSDVYNKPAGRTIADIPDYNKNSLKYEEDKAFQCSNGKNTFWVTWDGRMIPCSLLEEPCTYPFQKGFLAAWKELKELCDAVPVCQSCRQCSYKEYCLTCPARLRNETGSFIKPAPYLCEMAKERSNLFKQIVI